MTIGVDGNEANVTMPVGVSIYTLNLLNYFKKRANRTLKFKVFLRHPPLPHLPKESSYFTYEVVPGKFLWSQLFLPLRLYLKRDINIFFSPAHYAPRFSPVNVVVTIHDLSYFYFPWDFKKKDLYQLKYWTKYSILKAKKIIAVSQTTKKDLIKFYPVDEKKIEVIYNGYGKKVIKNNKQSTSEILTQYNLKPKKYILYVGTIQPRKNLETLIYAFEKLIKINNQYHLVIVGKKGWMYKNVFDLVLKLKLQEKVVFTDYLPDEKLAVLYKEAFCFVFPSLYEGFGIPLLEALSFSCPVIASSTSSLPEIGGNACLYFNPKDQDDLLEKILKLIKKPYLKNQLIGNGKKRLKIFSWERCGKKTLEILKAAAFSKNGS